MQGGWRYTPNATDSDLSHSGWAFMALRSARNSGAPVPRESFGDHSENNPDAPLIAEPARPKRPPFSALDAWTCC